MKFVVLAAIKPSERMGPSLVRKYWNIMIGFPLLIISSKCKFNPWNNM